MCKCNYTHMHKTHTFTNALAQAMQFCLLPNCLQCTFLMQDATSIMFLLFDNRILNSCAADSVDSSNLIIQILHQNMAKSILLHNMQPSMYDMHCKNYKPLCKPSLQHSNLFQCLMEVLLEVHRSSESMLDRISE